MKYENLSVLSGFSKLLLDQPYCYDIVIGDFGRIAAIDLVRLIAIGEQELLQRKLSLEGLEFFDEYRRISSSLICDIGFLKRSEISLQNINIGGLTSDILVGVKSKPVSDELVKNIAYLSITEAKLAVSRGYQRVRLCAPCNTLSDSMQRVLTTIRTNTDHELPKIELCTVVDAVVDLMASENSGELLEVLVLGTKETNSIYRRNIELKKGRVLPLDSGDYKNIDDAVLASISGKPEDINIATNLLKKEILDKYNISKSAMVIEACTDFNLNLGRNSLQMFAQWMIRDCYEWAL